MTSLADNNLTKEKIQQLLAAIGVKPDKDSMQNIEVSEYNWHQSHYFDRDQMQKINNFARQASQNIAKNFNRLYHCDFDVIVVSTTQHFASEFITSDNTRKNYMLAFGSPEHTFGLIDMPPQTAILWSTQLLGDTASDQNVEKDLSQLEQSLLFDIASTAIEALSDSFNNQNLKPVGEIVRGHTPVEIDSLQEICKIALSVKKSNSEKTSEACFWVFCDKLHTIASQKTQNENISPQVISKAMLNYVQSVQIPITIKFADGKFNFQQIMTLQAGDILMLDKNISEPSDLIINDRTLLRGRPAKSGNKFAMVITELCNTK